MLCGPNDDICQVMLCYVTVTERRCDCNSHILHYFYHYSNDLYVFNIVISKTWTTQYLTSNLDRGLSRVKSRGVISVVRRPHLYWYNSFKQYVRRSCTKPLSNVWVCCKPFDARYIWLNTCNPHAFSCGVCSVHVTGALVWNPGNKPATPPLWLYNFVM